MTDLNGRIRTYSVEEIDDHCDYKSIKPYVDITHFNAENERENWDLLTPMQVVMLSIMKENERATIAPTHRPFGS